MPDLSVLTLVKNRQAHLLRLIEGLARGTTPPGELIIVNMGQAPITIPDSDFPIHIVEHPSQGLPLAQARNLAASRAIHEKLLFLDVDCIPMRGLPTAILQTLDHFNGLLCAEIRYLAAQDIGEGWQEDQLLQKAAKHPIRDFPISGLKLEQNYGLFWSLAFAMHRRQFFQLGGFDENFTGYGAEDTEFAFRAKDAGLELAFLGGPGAFHQHHEIFNPPLQHFDDIIRNAQRFRSLRGTWPMQGWLAQFEAMKLIAIEPKKINILRRPSAQERAAAKKPVTEFF